LILLVVTKLPSDTLTGLVTNFEMGGIDFLQNLEHSVIEVWIYCKRRKFNWLNTDPHVAHYQAN